MLIQEVMHNMRKRSHMTTENALRINKCPWEDKYIAKHKKDIWEKGKGITTIGCICPYISDCAKCKRETSDKFIKLTKVILKKNKLG